MTAPAAPEIPVTAPDQIVARIREQREKVRIRLESLGYKPRLKLLVPIWLVVLGLIVWGVYSADPSQIWTPLNVTLELGGAPAFAVLVYYFVLLYVRLFLKMVLKQYDAQLQGASVVQLQETLEEDFFTKLVQINFKYIDGYYLQTQSQANNSFVLSAVVAMIGLGIIATGIVMMFKGKTQPAYVTTAAGVLGEFISAVFFYLYNRTVLKMSEYHQKLVITQNIGLALRITRDLPESDRVSAQKTLVLRLTEGVNQYLTAAPPASRAPANGAKTPKRSKAIATQTVPTAST
jgi:hypothetical protein